MLWKWWYICVRFEDFWRNFISKRLYVDLRSYLLYKFDWCIGVSFWGTRKWRRKNLHYSRFWWISRYGSTDWKVRPRWPLVLADMSSILVSRKFPSNWIWIKHRGMFSWILFPQNWSFPKQNDSQWNINRLWSIEVFWSCHQK